MKTYVHLIIATLAIQTAAQGSDPANNYVLDFGKRCIGDASSRIGDLMTDLSQCFDVCDTRTDCYGVNYAPVIKACTVRTAGCKTEPDDNTLFYRKTTSRTTPGIVSTTKLANDGPTTLAVATILAVPVTSLVGDALAKYEVMSNRRCVGGAKIGESLSKPTDCAKLCESQPDCFGFNWVQQLEICVARRVGCSLEPDGASVFYVLKTAKTQITTTGTPNNATTVTAPKASRTGYDVFEGTICSGGVIAGNLEIRNVTYCFETCENLTNCFAVVWYGASENCSVHSVNCTVKHGNSTTLMYRRITNETQPLMINTAAPIIKRSELMATTALTTPRSNETTTTVVPSSSTMMTSASSAASELGFLKKIGIRCSGGISQKIGDTADSVEKCASFCSMTIECFGFNWQTNDRRCVCRSAGCDETPDTYTVFYQKDGQQSMFDSTSKKTTPRSTSVSTSTTTVPDIAVALTDVWGFKLYNQTRCVSQLMLMIVMSFGNVQFCVKECQNLPLCAGFEISLKDGMCNLRSNDCTMQQDASTVYYQLIPSTVFTTAATSDPTNGFSSENGTRCVGGTSVTLISSYSLKQCASVCLGRDDCAGFNWLEREGWCAARTIGCNKANDTNGVFYRKKTLATTTTMLKTKPTNLTTTTLPPSTQPPKLFDNYLADVNKVCSGQADTQIGELQEDPAKCAAICDRAYDCLGFNWFPSAEMCVVRTTACEMASDKNAVFYQKTKQWEPLHVQLWFPSTATTTTTQKTTTFRNLFKLEAGKRCTGGSSYTLAASPNVEQCVAICSEDPDCVGYNLARLDGRCIARSFGCQEMDDENIDFYRKTTPLTESLETTPTSTTLTAATTVPEGYSIEDGKRCSAGTSYSTGSGLIFGDCIANCNARDDCIGVNIGQDLRCVARTFGCLEQYDSRYVFYRKRSQTKPQQKSTATTQDTTTRVTTTTQKRRSISSGLLLMPSLANFRVFAASRCQGGNSVKIGAILDRLDECASLCLQRDDCYGFNWQREGGACVARTSGCKEEFDAGFIFYRKVPPQAMTQLTTTEQTFARQMTTQKEEDAWETSLLLPNFLVRMGRTCNGDSSTQIGDVQTDARKCGAICDTRSDCFGFTWFPKSGTCIVRSLNCQMATDDSQALLYRKAPPKTTPTTTLNPIRNVLSNYLVKEETRCAGGTSMAIGGTNGLDACLQLCSHSQRCYGFNFVKASGDCALRTANCNEERSAGLLFYVRKRDF